MTEPLPCPFCGNEASSGEYGDNSPSWFVACSQWECSCMLDGFPTEDAAISAWNKRAQWEPLPDGEYGNLDTVTVSGDTITIYSAIGVGVRRQSAMLDLPDNIRLCKREKE